MCSEVSIKPSSSPVIRGGGKKHVVCINDSELYECIGVEWINGPIGVKCIGCFDCISLYDYIV